MEGEGRFDPGNYVANITAAIKPTTQDVIWHAWERSGIHE
jgi:hypothetical protein